jgi:parvulin-like peptidyl-prolyl isomerase
MTSDKKTRGSATAHRRPLDPEERFQRRVTLAFIALTVAIVAVVVIGIGYGYWDQHLKPVASVDGTGISKDEWADRARLETFRLERQDRRITQAIAAGTLTADQGSQLRTAITTAQNDVSTSSIESLIDLLLKGQLASKAGITVTDADVDAAVAADATTPEARQVGLITITPEVGSDGETTGAARQAALTAANEAVAALAAGTAFGDVARKYSTDATKDKGGDYGSIFADDTTLDPALVGAIFAANQGDTTPLLANADGSYSIARVDGITPAAPDASFEKDLRSAMSWDAYRTNVRKETVAAKLAASIVAGATTGDQPQLHLAEIWLAGDPTAAATDTGRIRASHILYSPEDDPSKARSGSTGTAGGIPPTDPSWTVAQSEAGLAFQELNGITDVAARQAAFAEMAKAHSDDTGSGAKGGDLGYFTRDTMVTEFGDALFDHVDTLKPGDVIGPVKTDFGYHVIMFEGYQAPLADRLDALKTELAKPGADFAAIAKASSDGAQAPNGGDLGWRTQAQLPADASAALLALAVGATSDPIQLTDGYHVYQLIDKADRPLDAAQVADLTANAFTDWYTPQKNDAEDSGKITRDDSIFSSSSTTGG